MEKSEKNQIKDTDIYGALENIVDRATFLRAINVSESLYSKWLSPYINGEDNHRRGPLEIIDAIEAYARAELDKAIEFKDETKILNCTKALELLGTWGAQKGKGVFVLRDTAKALVEAVEKAAEKLRQSFGLITIFFGV